MTCYNCFKCGRYEHLSKLGEFEITLQIGKIPIKFSVWLCKRCLSKAGITYYISHSPEGSDWLEYLKIDDERISLKHLTIKRVETFEDEKKLELKEE